MILNEKEVENRVTDVVFLSPCNFPFTASLKDPEINEAGRFHYGNE